MKLKSILAAQLLNQNVSKKEICKLLGVKYQWLLSVYDNKKIDFNFGVEIETLHEKKVELPEEFTVWYRLPYNRTPSNYDIDNMYHWKQAHDASINCFGEYISPILKGEEGLKVLKLFCEGLEKSGAKVDYRCGLHVHIDRKYFDNLNHILRFHDVYGTFQESINAMMPKSRRKGHHHADQYCLPTVVGDYPAKRCVCVNLQNSKTVELRQHSGTITYEKIYNWICIIHRLILLAKDVDILEKIKPFEKILNAKLVSYYKKRVAEVSQ